MEEQTEHISTDLAENMAMLVIITNEIGFNIYEALLGSQRRVIHNWMNLSKTVLRKGINLSVGSLLHPVIAPIRMS